MGAPLARVVPVRAARGAAGFAATGDCAWSATTGVAANVAESTSAVVVRTNLTVIANPGVMWRGGSRLVRRTSVKPSLETTTGKRP